MTKSLLTLNSPNLNNHTYTTEVIEKALKDSENFRYLERVMNFNGVVDLENVIGKITNIRVEKNLLIGDVELSKNLCSDDIAELIKNDDLTIRPYGIGELDKGQVYDYQLVGFAITNDPA